MNTFLRKIASRKLWIALVGVAVGLAAAFGVDESEYAPVVGIIGAIASCISYIIGEAKIDTAYAKEPKDEVIDTNAPVIGTTDPAADEETP